MDRVVSLGYYLREIVQLRNRLAGRDARIATLEGEVAALKQELEDERAANRGLQKAYDNKCKAVELMRSKGNH